MTITHWGDDLLDLIWKVIVRENEVAFSLNPTESSMSNKFVTVTGTQRESV